MQNKIREITLNQWLETVLADKSLDVTPASEDASFRRYFRVQRGGETWIAMDAPPDKEDCRPFVKIAAAFRFMGMNVPEVYAQDLDNGFLLLTDFGSICYLDRLNQRNADDLYADAMHALLDLQSHEKPRNVDLPAYDEVLLRQEMGLFNDWFLDRHVQIRLDESEASDLQVVQDILVENARVQETVWVHRDYHSRNLMFTKKQNPGIIDFQDAVEGPITYDLVSLLRDCYIRWPEKKVEQWLMAHFSHLQQRNLCQGISPEIFRKWFDLMGVQRHLKAIGIFARLNYRDGKPEYLNDIPRTLAYVHTVTGKYEALKNLHQLISSRILPALKGKK